MSKQIEQLTKDYTLRDNEGRQVQFSSFFGKHDYLVVLHNMGKTCPNCALWGDEFNGMLRHIEKVAAFCVIGPDDPETQKTYVKERGWNSPLYSAQGTSFIKDFGFEDEKGNAQPGVSVLQKKNGTLALLQKVNVMRDKKCPSVLEVFWMLPGVKTVELAWHKSS